MRAFFFQRTWRERVLLMLVLLVAVVIWLGAELGRFRDAADLWRSDGSKLYKQSLLLEVAERNAADLRDRLSQVRQGRSLNANQLVGQLDAVAKRHRFAYRLDPPNTERRPPVSIHSVSLSIEKTDLATFGAFVDDLRENLPLVNVEQVVMTPDRRNPAQLDYRLKLSGLELLQ